MPTASWKKISSREVAANFRFRVLEDDVTRPDGSRSKYYYLRTSPGVAVIAYQAGKIYLVNQYRYVLQQRMWELPCGKAESSNYLAQAKKELKEETGISAARWNYVGSFHPSVGGSTSVGKVFLARGLSFGQPEREAGESDMYVKGFSLPAVDRLIARGKITDGWLMAALALFKLKFKRLLQ
ncbi:MAG TPA: NUDIX hydrolase [Patescibacteria group bacterium]|nr:NUDIX hydrolase [Patescibacteria group bacterium]